MEPNYKLTNWETVKQKLRDLTKTEFISFTSKNMKNAKEKDSPHQLGTKVVHMTKQYEVLYDADNGWQITLHWNYCKDCNETRASYAMAWNHKDAIAMQKEF